MGTRALVHFKEGDFDSPTIVTMYRQFDGYPENPGLGYDIYNALNRGNVEIFNGRPGQKIPAAFNGLRCLAAWLVGELKNGTIGNVYLYPPDSSDCGEEFTYTLYEEDGELCMCIEGSYNDVELGRGPLKDFDTEKGIFAPVGPKDKEFTVQSDSNPMAYYDVTHVVEKWTCTCRDHIFRKHDCKHIREARGF